jgi:BNR/Asp-box repeat
MNKTLPAGAPALQPGVWTDITPAALVQYKGTNQTMIAQGIALDPCDVSTLYWCTTPFDTTKGGLFRSRDAGATWTKVGNFDAPLHIRIDPKDSAHMYVGDGVRGATMGFWVSKDGGATWVKPKGFQALPASIGITSSSGMDDIYDIAVDPTDFNHVLLSFHSPFTWNDSNRGAGVAESKDGGETWVAYEQKGQWGYGHSISFLFAPGLGIGNSNTWLLSTQGAGRYRTTDGGKTWAKVTNTNIFHGGGTVFYNPQGVLFASGAPDNLRSTDNGVTWTTTGPGQSTCVFGDGTLLYSAPALGDNPWFTSPESDGTKWTPYANGAQKWHNGGPFEIAYDATNGILYSSNWEMGAMALKIKR